MRRDEWQYQGGTALTGPHGDGWIRLRRVRSRRGVGASRETVCGFVLHYPKSGLPLTVYSELGYTRFLTSRIRRVLGDGDRQVFFVETSNSLYRVQYVCG